MKLKRIASSLAAGIFAISSYFFNTQLVMANDTDNIYVLMNIPYDEFYKEEISNSVKVDSVSSATRAKTRTGRLTTGSYHADDSGESIDGITFCVKTTRDDLSKLEGAKVITDDSEVTITVSNRGQTQTTTYTGKDALYEAPDYSYYVLEDIPSYYKEMSVDSENVSFSEIKGTYTTVATLEAGKDISYTFTNDSSYGDFQLNFDTEEGAAVLGSYFDYEKDDIYGVIVSTAEGGQYALRHLENIWLGSKLAWSAGVVTEVHGCELSYDHYKAMAGQTITGVTYLTEKGKIEITGLNEKVELQEFEPMTDEQRKQLEELNETIKELLKDYDRETATEAEGDLYAHMRELTTLLNSQKASVTAAEELLGELPEKIKAVQDERQIQTDDEEKETEDEDNTDNDNNNNEDESETEAASANDKTDDSNKTDSGKTPTTGDNSSAAAFTAAIAAALFGAAAFSYKKKEA